MLRLSRFTGSGEDERIGASALRVARRAMERAPSAVGHALGALDLYLSAPREVAIIGEPMATDTAALVSEVWRRFAPNAVLAAASPGDADAARAVPLLADRAPVDGRATAYVCERFACRLPVTDPAELAAQLDA
jgi:uncharacterized protein YyaL (SSP411 family)